MKNPNNSGNIVLGASLNEIARQAGMAALTGICSATKTSRDAHGAALYPKEFMETARMAHLIGVHFAMEHLRWAGNMKDQPDLSDENVQVVAYEMARIGKAV